MMQNLITKNYDVNINNIGYNKRLSFVELLKMFQDLATAHAGELGLGYYDLAKKDNAFWVLSKLKVRFVENLPEWGKEVSVQTFPLKPTSSVRFERCFSVMGDDNNHIACAESEWCMLDKDTRKIKKLSAISCMPQNMEYLTESCLQADYTKNFENEFSKNDLVYSKKVSVSDLDLNKHVNNVIYSQMAYDCFDSDFLDNNFLYDYEIHYVKETVEGDELLFFKKQVSENVFDVVVKNKKSDEVVVKTKFTFKNL